MTKILASTYFAMLAALAATVIFAHRPELRAAAMIFATIGMPCILGIFVQLDPSVRK